VTYDEAYERVDKGERFEDPGILRLVGVFGWSIAHIQAQRCWITEDPKILSLAYKRTAGVTVAHLQAHRGWTTLDPNILSLVTMNGETVLDRMLRRGWKPQTEEEKLVVFTVKAGS